MLIHIDDYGVAGGEVVVLIHGIGGSPTIWFRQLRELKKVYRVLAVHLPGHGKNGVVREKVDLDRSLEDVRCAVKERVDSKFHVVGISLGSLIINKWVQKYPKDLKSAVCGGMITGWTLYAKTLLKTAVSLRKVLGVHFLYKVMAWIMMPKKAHRASRIAFVKESSKVDKESLLNWLPVIVDVDNQEVVCSGDVKQLYISGSHDYMFIEDVVEVAGEKGIESVVISGAGHVCNIDNAVEFNKVMMNHLKKADCGG